MVIRKGNTDLDACRRVEARVRSLPIGTDRRPGTRSAFRRQRRRLRTAAPQLDFGERSKSVCRQRNVTRLVKHHSQKKARRSGAKVCFEN
jgi:hypothetical protein